MAKAYRCDRCQTYFTRAIRPEIEIRIMADVNKELPPYAKIWDLCPGCQRRLKGWMNRGMELKDSDPDEAFEWAEDTASRWVEAVANMQTADKRTEKKYYAEKI